MADLVLTADALAYCPDTAPTEPVDPPPPAGRLAFVATQQVLTVGGIPVLLATDVGNAKIATGCPLQPPCATIATIPEVTGSSVLTVDGVPVATEATVANTNNAVPVTVIGAGQPVLSAG